MYVNIILCPAERAYHTAERFGIRNNKILWLKIKFNTRACLYFIDGFKFGSQCIIGKTPN